MMYAISDAVMSTGSSGITGGRVAIWSDNRLRAGGEQASSEQFHPLAICDKGRQFALCEEGKDSLFRLFQADRNIRCSCPTRAEQGNASINSPGGEDPNPRRTPGLALAVRAANQAGGQARRTLGQLAVGQGVPLADHRWGFRGRLVVAMDGAGQVVIIMHLTFKNAG
jgi:hypothetical protein